MILSAMIFVPSGNSGIGKLAQILYFDYNERSEAFALFFFYTNSNVFCLALNKFPAVFKLFKIPKT